MPISQSIPDHHAHQQQMAEYAASLDTRVVQQDANVHFTPVQMLICQVNDAAAGL
jgi:hypothetical protein